MLVLSPEEVSTISRTQIDHYTFNWPYQDPQTGKQRSTQALALGLGSMFNHSRDENVGFQRHVPDKILVFSTLRNVAPHEELCISYGPRLWFEDTEKRAGEGEEENEETNPDVLACIALP